MLADPLFVFAVSGRCSAERPCELRRSGEGRGLGVHATGQARGDLLEEPAVAVRILERGERAVAPRLWIRTADPVPSKQIGLVRATDVCPNVEWLAHLDAATEQIIAGRLDVGDNQIESFSGA